MLGSILNTASSAVGGIGNNLKNASGKLDLGSIFGNKFNGSNDDLDVVDSEWVEGRFISKSKDLPTNFNKFRFFSTVSRKYTDTSLGGNIPINPRPQYTPYCDIRWGSKYNKNETTILAPVNSLGMGRVYSEYIDDNQQCIFLTFGLPRFNGMLEFFSRAVDYEDSVIANSGRSPLGYNAGQVVGDLIMFAAFPFITSTIWAIKGLSALFTGNNAFSYYYLEPNMFLYWSTVNNLVTTLATELGLLSPILETPKDKAKKVIGVPAKFYKEDLEEMSELLPGILDKNTGYIDVFRIATRAQTIANNHSVQEMEAWKSGKLNGKDYQQILNANGKVMDESKLINSFSRNINHYTTFQTYLEKIKKSGLFGDTTEDATAGTSSSANTEQEALPIGDGYKNNKIKKNPEGEYQIDLKKDENRFEKFIQALDSTARDGALYAIFAVDYVGTVSESFSNSTSSIGLGAGLKQIGSATRDLRFNIAGGNLTDTVENAVKYAKDTMMGVLNSVTFGLDSVAHILTGGGLIDLPEKWEDSDTSFPTITYNMELRSPYGNVISQLTNIYIPLCMALAGVLPLATGKASYTSPFLCSLFSKGLQKIDLGIITSVTISRGEGNLGWNKQWRSLGTNISITVKDLSPLMAMPVNSSIFSVFKVALDDNSVVSRYLATLGSRDIYTDKYALRKLKLKASRLLMKTSQMISGSAWGLRTGENLNFVLGGLVSQHTLSLQFEN